MSKRRVKIVADSSADLFRLSSVDFEAAPLKIITADKEYVDDETLDLKAMVDELSVYSGRSSTSCPNASDWLNAFGDAEDIYCVTITATLSGSYNAAMLAKQTYEEQYPDRNVFVLNSLTAGPEIALILEKIEELVLAEKDFDSICRDITKYSAKTKLLFMLESMKNLANNGRVSPLVAKMAGLLGIRVVGKASDVGDLEPLGKCRGEKRALEAIVKYMKSLGFSGGRIRIAHCFNETAASELCALIKKEFKNAQIKFYSCKALCSFYAESGGLLVGFETM